MKKIFIRMGSEPEKGVSWAEVADNGTMECLDGTLQEAAARVDNHQVILLVPATEVVLLAAMVPGRNPRQIFRAIPYALEESLAAEVEKQHFALGPRNGDGSIPVAVVDAATMAGWLQSVHHAGIDPQFVVPESLALPIFSDSWSLLCDKALAIARTGPQSGFALEMESLPLLLSGKDLPAGIRVYNCPGDSPPLARIASAGLDLEVQPAVPLEVFAGGFDEKAAINLLQGGFSPRTMLARIWNQWRLNIILLLGAVLLYGFLVVSGYVQLRNESRDLSSRIEAVFRQTFPSAQKVVKPRVQMENRLQSLRAAAAGQDSFLFLVRNISPLLLQTEGFVLQGLRYKEGGLGLDFAVKNLQVLDELKGRLSQTGLAVEIQTASSRDGQVRARMQIKGRLPDKPQG